MNGTRFTTNEAGRGVWQRESDAAGWVKLLSPDETPVWSSQIAFAVWVAMHLQGVVQKLREGAVTPGPE